jgi:hypothetical protein
LVVLVAVAVLGLQIRAMVAEEIRQTSGVEQAARVL